MRRLTAGIALAGASALGASAHTPLDVRVTVVGPEGDTLASVTPLFIVRTADIGPADRPLTLTLQIAERADFAGVPLLEVTTQSDTLRFTPPHPLPENRVLFWRARAITAAGREVFSATTGPRRSATWLTLLSPNSATGTTFSQPRPRFVWRSAGVTTPPGPWSYTLAIENVPSGQVLRYQNILDTTFTPSTNLETNTSFRWSVTATLTSGEVTFARSRSSFVIVDPGIPPVTLLYQNFPNPFPSSTSTTTCIWFDLEADSRVELTIHDVRGNLVKRLVPSAAVPAALPAGRYGRGTEGSNSGCDPRFTWDGRSETGDVVPTGVYLVRLRANVKESLKTALFRGR
jgi:hypothetical protein